MWNKPEEISSGSYTSNGYEISASGYGSVQSALNGWKNSPGHNDVILNQGIWTNYPWQAMGVGTNFDNEEGYRFYFVWFATAPDPYGVSLCTPDDTPPEVTPPQNLTLPPSAINGVPVSEQPIQTFLSSATALDDVDGAISPVLNDAPATFPLGETTVTFSATDAAGNTGNAQATVTVTYTPDLTHLIKVLKIGAGDNPDSSLLTDINEDGIIGLAEALFILQFLME